MNPEQQIRTLIERHHIVVPGDVVYPRHPDVPFLQNNNRRCCLLDADGQITLESLTRAMEATRAEDH